ncbi:MAG: HAD-IB family phosphatase [Caldisphaera sp.]|jgi:phosphoserine phosphatase|nr:MAG: phosphoserine phosphatase [Caldisphaera sp.]PMP92277.1 MAG: phosphoserine phosphatase [Caldisphaera sp.]
MNNIKLVVFDVDGVLTNVKSSWEFLHEYFDVADKAKEYYKKFEKGEIDYMEWMRLDTSLWIDKNNGKLKIEELVKILSKIPVRDEIKDVSICLHKNKKTIALLSGGIDILVNRIADIIGAEIWMANELEFNKFGYLVPGGLPMVGTNKEKALMRILQYLNVEPQETMYVGDSKWDYNAMIKVGYPVLFGNDESLLNISKYKISNLNQICDIIKKIEGK